MSHPWFRKFGWVYRPVSVAGWVIVAIALALTAQAFVAIDRHSHSASDTLWGVFPYAALFAILVQWVASNTSDRKTG